MLDNIQVIILAAGKGTRLQDLLMGESKVLVDYGNEPLIHRTIRQLNEIGLNNILVVTGYKSEEVSSSILSYFPKTKTIYNERFDKDKNIYSLSCAIKKNSKSSILIIEGDVVLSDKSILKIRNEINKNDSFWTAYGKFKYFQKGGIINIDKNKKIKEITYTSEYKSKYKDYYKNLGVIFCGSKELPIFSKLLDEYVNISIDEYFMTPWAKNISQLPARLVNLGEQGGASFNTKKELEYAQKNIPPKNIKSKSLKDIALVPVNNLYHIEGYDKERVKWLAKKISVEGIWKHPLVIDSKYNLVMDGQHRLEAALLLDLKHVPVVMFPYSAVEVWSLRPDTYTVTVDDIIQRVKSNNIYPYKTAKHLFPEEIPVCSFNLDILKKDKV